MRPFNPVIIISGPTASGKTSLSIEIAKKYQCEIINFDSLLFYKEIDIGVAKPSLEELSITPHHFVSFRSIKEPLNAHQYSELAIPKINKLLDNNVIPILVGGSGFYLQAVIQGMYDSKPSTNLARTRSDNLYLSEGIQPFIEILKEKDKESFQRYHSNDHYRIRRAVEYYWDNKIPISQARSQKNIENRDKSRWPKEKYNWTTLNIFLDPPKPEHEKIIRARTNGMIEEGLINEVKEILSLGFEPKLKPLQSIGYKETIDFLDNKFSSKEEYIERINISTRQLAKSQRTWFNKKEKETYNPLREKKEILIRIDNFLKN